MAACATAPLERRVEAALADPDLAGTRWGLVVSTLDGEELVAIRPDERFLPASNVKLFTTAAVYRWLDGLEEPTAGAAVRLEPDPGGGQPDLALVGTGDAHLSDRPECVTDCLAALADAVAAAGVRRVRHVIGDDRLFPDERWSPGWSWDDLALYYGAGVSALTVNDNTLVLEVRTGAAAGDRATAAWREGDYFFPLTADVVTAPAGAAAALRLDRAPGDDAVRVYGSLPVGGRAVRGIGAEDPARLAALRLKRLLEARGVVVEGEARGRSRSHGSEMILAPPFRGSCRQAEGDCLGPAEESSISTREARPPQPAGSSPRTGGSRDHREIARLSAPPLEETIRVTLVDSQNLYAELLLRRLGLLAGDGSREDGLALVEAMLAEAGVPRAGYDLADGSGLSIYNRVSPRAMTTFLVYAAGQPWGEAWRAKLPVGGADGTLARRFRGGALEGRVIAKTGTLTGVTALSGYLVTDSGETLAFAAFANDRPYGVPPAEALAAMDRALEAVARGR